MKSKKIIAAISIALIMVAVTGCGQASTATNKTVTAAKKTQNTVEASGVVKANNSENIVIDFPQTATPKITKVAVQEGQKVKKGDKLFELDLTDFNATVVQQQKTVDADVQAKNIDIQTKNAELESKNADVISKNSANTDDEKNTVQAKINADDARINADDAKIKADEAKIEADQADLNAIKAKLNKSYLKDGSVISDLDNAVVTDITYAAGDLASSAKSLVTLQDLNSLYIQANVSEEFIKDVQVGKIVQITPTSNPGAKLTGKVTGISSTAVTQNGDTSIPVNISIDNNNGVLLPNYNVDVQIDK